MVEASRLRTQFSLLAATLLLSPGILTAQTPSKTYTAPKTAWGDPDLQGIFTNATVTPFERPAEFAGNRFLPEKKLRGWEAGQAGNRLNNPRGRGGPVRTTRFWETMGP